MGGGNAQKSATARQRNLEKNESSKVYNVLLQPNDDDIVVNDEIYYIKYRYQNAGGGLKGKEARSGGDMASAMAAAQGE